jgi:predicted nucleic acid-binding protein
MDRSTGGNLIAKKSTIVASFIDANVFVYAESKSEPQKQRIAVDLLRKLYVERSGVLSTQVLQEYSSVLLKKMKYDVNYVQAQIKSYSRFEIIHVTPTIIQSALDLLKVRSISFWDALIVQAAVAAGCSTLYTEDLNEGEQFYGLTVINPFKGA